MKEHKNIFCAPGVYSKGNTCYSKKDLLILINSYNKDKKDKINTINKSKKELWVNLNNRLNRDCNNEMCWLEKKFIPAPYANKLKEKFKPKYPKEWLKNPFEWLSTTDIRKVMKQYEKKYPSFLFMGPVPVDCPESIQCSLSGLNVELLINRLGKNKLGVIYNLDKHDEPGSHWVASYFDFKKGTIYYFDSVGLRPPDMILHFLNKMKNSCKTYYKKNFNINKNVNIYSNNTRFQFGNSECGMFSMNFIISNLNGKNINKKNTTDKKMNELRNKYYRPHFIH